MEPVDRGSNKAPAEMMALRINTTPKKSLYRLDQRYYGKESDYDKLRERAVKEAIHEIAHCFGLEHCKNRECVLSFSTNVMAVDAKTKHFCESCRRKIKRAF